MKYRTIKKIIPSQKINMGGHILEQPLPNAVIDQLDPFLLIHHGEWQLAGNQRQQEVGIGSHPHRGFSPVTFVFNGDIQHQDSFGNNKIVYAGGTQWMHAGKGIVHSERPSKALASKGGFQEIIQLWINSPAEHKMDPPTYLPLAEEDTPSIKGEQYKLYIVAGEYEDIKGPAPTFTPMLLMRGQTESKAQLSIETSPDFNTLMYLLDGRMLVNGNDVKAKNLIWFKNDGTSINIIAEQDTRFILLSGKPIGEEVMTYGPYVMNTQTEILEAIRDSQMGKMGVLIEQFD
jgi:redox-sensitive bicupin YhaK (pirin superfamily)